MQFDSLSSKIGFKKSKDEDFILKIRFKVVISWFRFRLTRPQSRDIPHKKALWKCYQFEFRIWGGSWGQYGLSAENYKLYQTLTWSIAAFALADTFRSSCHFSQQKKLTEHYEVTNSGYYYNLLLFSERIRAFRLRDIVLVIGLSSVYHYGLVSYFRLLQPYFSSRRRS